MLLLRIRPIRSKSGTPIFGRPFVKRFALCYRTVVLSDLTVCPVCLSVTLLYCGQTVGWIKMKLGMEIGLGPGHIVLDGDLAPPRGTAPIFGPLCSGTVAHLRCC